MSEKRKPGRPVGTKKVDRVSVHIRLDRDLAEWAVASRSDLINELFRKYKDRHDAAFNDIFKPETDEKD